MSPLDGLFKKFDHCPLCQKSNNKLLHILGGGKKLKPKVAFVLINPTYKNISSQPGYVGPRFPFIGRNNFWRVLISAGWLPNFLTPEFEWEANDVTRLLGELENRHLYITNVVKCTHDHGNYPLGEYFNYHLPLFFEELTLVAPESIIAFGGLPTKCLTGQNIKLSESAGVRLDPLPRLSAPVYPCYFPVGRGSPTRAIEVLQKLRKLLS